jgi:hypothetical protein
MGMKKLLVAVFAACAVATLGFGQASALSGSPYPTSQNGVDLSWPNCSTAVPSGTPFGIVGVSGGLAYDAGNSCLSSEAKKFSHLSLYANTGLYIDSSTPTSNYSKAYAAGNCATAPNPAVCGAYNYGLLSGKQIATYSVAQGVSSPQWWLDIETSNTWNSNTSLNQQSLQGAYDGIHNILPSVTIGAYSTASQWTQITGSSFKPGWPVWYATTERKAASAGKYW